MGPWDREVITVDVRGKTADRVDVIARYEYDQLAPRMGIGGVSGPWLAKTVAVGDLVPWLASAITPPAPQALVHIRVRVVGPHLRSAVIALPWTDVVKEAVISIGRGDAPKRPGLVLPLQLSTTGTSDLLLARLDEFVTNDAAKAWTIRPQGHVVHAFAGDRLDNAVAARTRLVIIETPTLGEPPAGGFNVLQIAAPSEACVAFSRVLYRAIFHDAPLDAAVHEALAAAALPPAAVRFDLFADDEHCLRPRKALLDAADTLHAAQPHYTHAKPHESGFESLQSHGFGDAASKLWDTASQLDFRQEAHGVNHSVITLDGFRHLVDEAEAARAAADDIELDRSAQLWLADEHEQTIPHETPLAVGRVYQLRFQIASEPRAGATIARLSNDRVRELFTSTPALDLHVQLYADPQRLWLREHTLHVRLERWGATAIVGTECKALAPGLHQVRGCIFYKGNLLESLALQIGVERPGAPSRVDFTGVESFGAVASLPDIGCALWINDTETVHWIGVHSSADQPLVDVGPGDLRLAPVDVVARAIPPVRTALGVLEGIDDTGDAGDYRFTAHDDPTQAAIDRSDELLCELARTGRRMFLDLLQGPNVVDDEYLAALAARLKAPDQILSIARLDAQSSVPWSIMYDLRIDPAEQNLEACRSYLRIDPDTKRPFAESPQACRGQADCPLGAVDTARTHVCPFGFWGFRHQIELRLRPKDGGVTPVDRTRISAADRPRAAAAMYAFAESAGHLQQLAGILEPGNALSDRASVLQALRDGDRSLYYFFCHAEQDKTIQLKLATDQFVEPGSIAARYEAADDGWSVATWADTRPLVFLNACQSIALDAASISPFLDRFVGLGASALIGTEIRVFTELAAVVAAQLLERMVTHHEPLGAALLAVRRRMLGTGNPMGLAYSAYGSAALHFHRSACNCTGATK